MKNGRHFGTAPDAFRKGVFWRIAIFSILASVLIAGSASSLLVQNAYAANTLVISAVALDGRVLNMWTTISSGGSIVRSGLTPLTFAGTTGAAYSVTVSDYGSIFFDHWENGSTARTRTLTLNADTAITASYRTASTHNLVVNSADMAGNALTGLYTVIRAGSATVRTGFTSLSFAGNHGTSYSVTVSDYGTRVFDHWENGSTARTRTLTLNADTAITAHYSSAPRYTLSVSSVGQSGSALTGYYTTIAAGGATVRTGFTPLTYQGNSGVTLIATVSDYGSNVFERWEDGSTSRSRTVTLTKDTTIVAHYRNTALLPPPPPPSYTLAVNSTDMAGNAITGYGVTIQSGSTATVGTTPWAFTGIGGTAYTVIPADGNGMTFDHWENDAEERGRTVTLGANTTLTAFYRAQEAEPDPNNSPAAADDSAGTNQNVAVTASVLANDSDPDGDSLTAASVTDPANGSAAVNGDGAVTYTPDPGFVGTDAFDYTLSDGKGGTDVATVTITVNAVIPPPPPPPTTYTLAVRTADMAGGAINGYYTTIAAGGATVRTGFTSLSHVGNAGATYSVTVSDYGTRVFDHWENGSTARTRTLTLDANTAITAHLRDTAPPPPPPVPDPDPIPIADLIPKTGVFVALYMWPGGSGDDHWQKVIDEKTKHPSVPIVAAFNPSSGPGNNKDPTIASWVNKLKQAGVIAIGYTYDDYGTRSLAALKADADKYRNWYGADGLFIDEFTNKAGFEGHYSSVTAYAKSIGMKMTMGNPGTDVPRSYIGTVDVINITEGRGYMPMSWLQYCIGCSSSGWHHLEDKRNFAYIRYDISTLNTTFETESARWVGLLYIHTGNDSNGRWFTVPPYFGTLVSTLDR